MNYEEILGSMGGCGPYQLLLVVVLGLTCLLAGMDLEANIFMHYTPKFTCRDPVFLQAINSTDYLSQDACVAVLRNSSSNSTTSNVIKCTQWEYDQSVMRSTLVTEFNLVCDKAYFTATIEALYFTGITIGMLVGVLGDRYGRRRVILVCAAWEILTSVVTPLTYNLYLLVALRFARGFSQSIYYQGVALLSELVPMKYRAVYGTNYWLFWALGYITIPGIAYLTREWRLMRWYANIPLLTYLTFYFLVPESPRWLSSVGRNREAHKELCRIARWNGYKDLAFMKTPVPVTSSEQPSTDTKIKVLAINEEEKEGSHNPDSMLDAFRLPNMRVKTLTFWMILSSVAIGYFGLSTDEKFASDNLFLNVFYMGLIEFPTGPVGWILCDKVGRRVPLVMALFNAGIAILCTPFLRLLPFAWLTTVVAILGKFLLTVAYQVADIYVVEIFPTTLRNMGVFSACMWAQVTTIVAPFINRLSQHVFFGTALIFSVAILLSALLTCLYLPETKNCPLAQTVSEAERFRRGNEKEWSREILREQQHDEDTVPLNTVDGNGDLAL